MPISRQLASASLNRTDLKEEETQYLQEDGTAIF